MAKKHVLSFLAMLLLMQVNPGNGGLIILGNSSFTLVSDGVGEVQKPDFIVLEHWPSSDHGSSYSQRIVSRSIIFLILVYVSLMLFAAKLLYDGSELLVEAASPKITGGVFLPLIASVLDAFISFASNLCGYKESAENDKVSARTGLLAGSTGMLLILLGGSCIIDGSALRTDLRASYSARIMVISVMPFIALQLSQVLTGNSPICWVVFALLMVSVSLLLQYCLYQVFHPSFLKTRLAYANPKHIPPKTLLLGRLLITNNEADAEDIRKLFQETGKNSDQLFSASDAVGDSKIGMDVFIKEICKWVWNLNEVAKIENPNWDCSCKAVLMLVLGSLVMAIFADPLINAVGDFSTSTNIPSCLVSFAALPFAISSEAVSDVMFASQNNLKISLTFSKMCGAVSMNNFLCLSVFLGLLYFRHLTWNFTSEVLIILIVWSFLPKRHGMTKEY